MRKPTEALLFDPVAREAKPITYDRADPRRFVDLLGEGAVRTPIEVQGAVRWFVYSAAASTVLSGLGIRLSGRDTEMLFTGVVVLVGNRGRFERGVDFDLLWPTFEFRWIGESEHPPFKLGRAYNGHRCR